MRFSPGTDTDVQERPLLLTLLVANMLEALVSILVILSTPAILSAFDEPLTSGGILLTAYFLPFVALMPLWARLGDVLGRRRVFLFSLALYIIGSIVALAALSFWWLIIGRIIQGLGNSANEPLAISIIGDLIAVERRGRALGIWGTAGSIAASAALIGGPLVDTLGWRSIFLVCALVSLISLALIHRHLPAFPRRGTLALVDWRGAVTFTAGLLLVVTAVTNSNIWGWTSLPFLLCLLAGTIALAMTPWMRGSAKQPFLDYRVLSSRAFWFASLAAAAAVFTLTGATLILPLYLSAVEQLNTSQTGVILFINGTGLFLGALAGGVATDRWHSRLPAAVGLGALGLSMLAMGLLTSDGMPLIAAAFTAVGFATGLCFAPLSTVITRLFSAQDLSAASGAYNLIRRTGTIMGAAVATAVLELRLGILTAVAEGGAALVMAYRETFWLLGGFAILAVFFAWRISSDSPLQHSASGGLRSGHV